MKVEGNAPNISTDATTTERVEVTRTHHHRHASHVDASGDHVQVSSDAQLAATAVDAAKQAPDIRTDKVERAKALLADGTLGQDAGKLADSLIDHLLEK